MPAIDNNNIIDETNCVNFTGTHIFATNGKIYISIPFETEFKVSVMFNVLFKFLNKIKKDEIDFISNDENLIIKAGKHKLTLQKYNLNENKYINQKFNFNDLPNDFIDAIKTTMSCCSLDDQLRLFTKCLHINKNFILTTDGKRMCKYTLDKEINDELYIDISTIKSLLCINNINKYCITNTNIIFTNDENLLFICNTIDTTFPDFEEVFKLNNKKELLFPDDITQLIELCTILKNKNIDDNIFFTNLQFSVGKLIISCINESAKLETIIKNDCFTENISFNINPFLLLDILKKSYNKIYYDDNKIIFENDKYKYVIALIK